MIGHPLFAQWVRDTVAAEDPAGKLAAPPAAALGHFPERRITDVAGHFARHYVNDQPGGCARPHRVPRRGHRRGRAPPRAPHGRFAARRGHGAHARAPRRPPSSPMHAGSPPSQPPTIDGPRGVVAMTYGYPSAATLPLMLAEAETATFVYAAACGGTAACAATGPAASPTARPPPRARTRPSAPRPAAAEQPRPARFLLKCGSMKPLVKWLLIALGALPGARRRAVLIAVVTLVDPDRFRPAIVAAVQQSTGRTLTLDGDVGLKLLPCCAVEVTQAALGNPPGFDRPSPSCASSPPGWRSASGRCSRAAKSRSAPCASTASRPIWSDARMAATTGPSPTPAPDAGAGGRGVTAAGIAALQPGRNQPRGRRWSTTATRPTAAATGSSSCSSTPGPCGTGRPSTSAPRSGSPTWRTTPAAPSSSRRRPASRWTVTSPRSGSPRLESELDTTGLGGLEALRGTPARAGTRGPPGRQHAGGGAGADGRPAAATGADLPGGAAPRPGDAVRPPLRRGRGYRHRRPLHREDDASPASPST